MISVLIRQHPRPLVTCLSFHHAVKVAFLSGRYFYFSVSLFLALRMSMEQCISPVDVPLVCMEILSSHQRATGEVHH